MKLQLKADLMLLLVTFFWGASILLTKLGLDGIEEYNLIALRFIIAFLLSGLIFYKHLFKVDFKTVKYAFILASVLFIVYIFATFGTKYTSVSNAGFLLCLTVIFIPILSAIFLKHIPEKKVIVGIILTIIGIGLLTLTSEFKIGNGDIFCILSALFYAIHVIITGSVTKHVNSIALGVVQLGFVGLFSLIFSLEPVFSAGFAFVFTGETLTGKGYLGATLILLSVLIAELDFKSLLRPNYKKNIE